MILAGILMYLVFAFWLDNPYLSYEQQVRRGRNLLVLLCVIGALLIYLLLASG